MNINYFLPDKNWSKDLKFLIFSPQIFLLIISTGLIGSISGPIALTIAIAGGGVIYYVVISIIIVALLKYNRDKKIKAIIQTYGDKYSEEELKDIYKNDKSEFNRIFKLASDEFFRNYIEEQANHKKAQELIKTLQNRINDMSKKYSKLKENEKKHIDEINELKNEIELYEDILANWKKEGGLLCLTN